MVIKIIMASRVIRAYRVIRATRVTRVILGLLSPANQAERH